MGGCMKQGCTELAHGRGLCQRHYSAARDAGEFEGVSGACSKSGCENNVYAKGFCRRHYASERRRKGFIGIAECSEDGCESVVHARTLCLKHYNAARASGAIGAPKCSRSSCTNSIYAKGVCNRHYLLDRQRANGVPLRERKVGAWQKNASGYVFRSYPIEALGGIGKKDRGWVRQLQHRVVMEEIIGRPLRPEENVHHINGQRDDNRPENLELWNTSQPPGQRVEDKIAWAKELLAIYEPSNEAVIKSEGDGN